MLSSGGAAQPAGGTASTALAVAMATPQTGWTVAGFRYYMYGPDLTRSLSFIYLANDPANSVHRVQFWWAPGRCQPTDVHGDWRELPLGALWLSFNGRGCARWRPLHSLHVWPIGARPRIYEGFDYQGRKIRMEHFVTFKMRHDGTFHAVNEDDFVIVQPVQELVEVPQLP